MNKYKFIIKSLLFTSVLSVLVGCSTDEKQKVTTMNTLVFQDEFNVNGALNNAYWTYDIGTGSNESTSRHGQQGTYISRFI